MGEKLAHSFSLGKHLHLGDAGHLLIAEYPQVVNQAIANFAANIKVRTV